MKVYINHRVIQSTTFGPGKYDTSRIKSYIDYLKTNVNNQKPLNKSFFQSLDDLIINFITSTNENDKNELDKSFNYLYLAINAITNFLELNSSSNIRSTIEFNYRDKNAAIIRELSSSDTDLLHLLHNYLTIEKYFISPNKVYIPTLRGSVILYYNKDNAIHSINTNTYETTVRKNYNLNKDINVSTGLNLYSEIKRLRNSRKEIREEFDAFEAFLKDNFFAGNQVDIVSLEEDKIIHIYIKGETDREIYNLGDGIQSLIILLYPIFTAPKKSWIFIEEPELNLHPGLQSLFLSTLMHNSEIALKELKVFISTHSNHMLDSILRNKDKCNIYSFEKINEPGSPHHNKSLIKQLLSPDANLLNLIGVHNSSVLLANVTIWVEGITDRKCIKAYLDSYAKSLSKPILIEGYHYSFIEYAGSNLKHFMFDISATESIDFIRSMSLSNRIYLVADKDENKEDKHDQYFSLNSDTFKYTHTGGLEIENTFSPSIISKILNDIFQYQISPTIKYEDYEHKKFGKYLSSLIRQYKHSPPKLASQSGSLETHYKIKFADFIYENTESNLIQWQMISENPHAKSLAINIYEFIVYHNSHAKV